jgi:hypothetical protein
MNGRNMIGVVLWADETACKAVIWCEDHGDLAYYSSSEQSSLDGAAFESGDLVEFEMTRESDLRYAWNPRLVNSQEFRGLDNALEAKADKMAPHRTHRHRSLPRSDPKRMGELIQLPVAAGA